MLINATKQEEIVLRLLSHQVLLVTDRYCSVGNLQYKAIMHLEKEGFADLSLSNNRNKMLPFMGKPASSAFIEVYWAGSGWSGCFFPM